LHGGKVVGVGLTLVQLRQRVVADERLGLTAVGLDGIHQDDVPAAEELPVQSQQVGAALDGVDVVGKARIAGEAPGELESNGVVAREGAAEADHEPGLHAGWEAADAGAAAWASAAGKRMVKVVPPPVRLFTSIVPPCLVTMP